MKVLQTVIHNDKYGHRKGNAARLALLDALLLHAAQRGCDLVALPAGFLRARNTHEVALLVADVTRRAKAVGTISVIGGIDAAYPAKRDLERRGRGLPYHGFAVDPQGAATHWQQQSYRRSTGTVANAVLPSARSIQVGGALVLPLTCGEMYNVHMRAALASSSISLIVDSGHLDIHRQLSRTLHNLSLAARCPVMLSQHVSGMGGKLHMVDHVGAPLQAPIRQNILLNMPAGTPQVAAVERVI
jgi:hypothetical protein